MLEAVIQWRGKATGREGIIFTEKTIGEEEKDSVGKPQGIK